MSGSSLKRRAKLLHRAVSRPPREDLTVPAYAYNFIKGGHSRTFMTWVLAYNLQLYLVGPMRRKYLVRVISRHMGLTRQQAYNLIRKGNRHFWDYDEYDEFLELRPRSAIHQIIKQNGLAPMRKSSAFGMPWTALRNLAALHAWMSFPVQSATEQAGTALAYPATCTGQHKDTAGKYRRHLKRARAVAIQRRFTKKYEHYGRKDDPLPGEFYHQNCPQLKLRRGTDCVFLDRSKIFAVDKSLLLTRNREKQGKARARRSRPVNFAEWVFLACLPVFAEEFTPVVFLAALPEDTLARRKRKPFKRRREPWQGIRPYHDPEDDVDGWEEVACLPPIEVPSRRRKDDNTFVLRVPTRSKVVLPAIVLLKKKTILSELTRRDGDPIAYLASRQETPVEEGALV